jgi:hypothetical protein
MKSSDRALDNHYTPSKANVGRTPIGDALIALMPWSADPCPHDNRPPFPGLHGFIRTLTGGRASVRAVQRWVTGSRPAPAWFQSVLRDQLLAKRNAIDKALQALAEYRGGKGRGAGLRDYWRDKRNREREEKLKIPQAP